MKLTPRERQVLVLVAEGRSDKDVARLLGMSVWTVRRRLRDLCDRLDPAEPGRGRHRLIAWYWRQAA